MFSSLTMDLVKSTNRGSSRHVPWAPIVSLNWIALAFVSADSLTDGARRNSALSSIGSLQELKYGSWSSKYLSSVSDNYLSTIDDGLETRAAECVDAEHRGMDGNSCLQGSVPVWYCGILPLTNLEHRNRVLFAEVSKVFVSLFNNTYNLGVLHYQVA